MPSLQIRNIPPELYEALTLRAKRENRSLAQQALAELERLPELEARDLRRRVLQRIRHELEAKEPRRPSVPPELLIREDRDR